MGLELTSPYSCPDPAHIGYWSWQQALQLPHAHVRMCNPQTQSLHLPHHVPGTAQPETLCFWHAKLRQFSATGSGQREAQGDNPREGAALVTGFVGQLGVSVSGSLEWTPVHCRVLKLTISWFVAEHRLADCWSQPTHCNRVLNSCYLHRVTQQ